MLVHIRFSLPAILLNRLKSQINALSEYAGNPSEFLSYFKEILIKISSQESVLGDYVGIKSFYKQYHLTPSANLTIIETLKSLAALKPIAYFEIAKEMLESEYLDDHDYAIQLLGFLFRMNVENVYEFMMGSLLMEEDKFLHHRWVQEIISSTINHKQTELWETVECWISSNEENKVKNAILITRSMIQGEEFENLPKIFHILEPLFLETHTSTSNEIFSLIHTLGKYFETETVSFIKSIIQKGISQNQQRFIRRAISPFSENAQNSIRKAME